MNRHLSAPTFVLAALLTFVVLQTFAAPPSGRSAALAPAEAKQNFVVPAGFEVRLFANEPMIVNPVAMTWDERGRLWVVELHE